MIRIALVALAAISVSGCASVTKGTDQQIVINTDPQGGRCEIVRDGQIIAVADPTPQPVVISKSRKDLQLTCSKQGYAESIHSVPSDVEAMTLGNVLLGGVIGVAVDAGTGAMNKYDANVTVPLRSAATPPQTQPAAPTPAPTATVAPTS